MGELGGKLWGFIGFEVHVIRWKVEGHSCEGSDRVNLREASWDQLVSKILAKRVVTLEMAPGALGR